MATKKIAVLFGMEDTFPWALMNEIRERSKGEIEGVPVEIGHFDDELGVDYDIVVDRISHEVPFYRTWLKKAIASGCQIVNNPIWWSADDKFYDATVAIQNGVAHPKTMVRSSSTSGGSRSPNRTIRSPTCCGSSRRPIACTCDRSLLGCSQSRIRSARPIHACASWWLPARARHHS